MYFFRFCCGVVVGIFNGALKVSSGLKLQS